MKQSFEAPKSGHEEQEQKNPYIETRDIYREHADPMQIRIAEIQAAKYETALYRLMRRTQDNPDLINALNEFLNALEVCSLFGRETEPLSKGQVEDLIKFFREKKEELWFLWGNRPATMKEN